MRISRLMMISSTNMIRTIPTHLAPRHLRSTQAKGQRNRPVKIGFKKKVIGLILKDKGTQRAKSIPKVKPTAILRVPAPRKGVQTAKRRRRAR